MTITSETAMQATDEYVASLSARDREKRLEALVERAHAIVDLSLAEHFEKHRVAGICVLFSGGNDSTVLAHLFRDRATHAIHANTTIGIENTREFVRRTCAEWDLPLIEKTPPRIEDHYKSLVLDQGFPGPGHHYKMFQRLKERGLRAAKNELVQNPRRERVLYIAGRRRAESKRRHVIPLNGRDRSIVWASPLLNWTKPDLNTYRATRGDVPQNDVAALIHMSGECLCGAFASPGERDQLDYWFRAHLGLIRWLEEELQKREYDHIPAYRKTWGWGAIPELAAQAPRRERKHEPGGLCEGCAYFPGMENLGGAS